MKTKLLILLLSLSVAQAALPVIPAAKFDAMMYAYCVNGKPDVITLGPGVYLTRASAHGGWAQVTA